MKESWIPPDESKNRDGEAEKLWPIGDGFSSDEASRRAVNGVLEEGSGLQIGLRVDDVIETPILDPFEANLRNSSALKVQKRIRAQEWRWKN